MVGHRNCLSVGKFYRNTDGNTAFKKQWKTFLWAGQFCCINNGSLFSFLLTALILGGRISRRLISAALVIHQSIIQQRLSNAHGCYSETSNPHSNYYQLSGSNSANVDKFGCNNSLVNGVEVPVIQKSAPFLIAHLFPLRHHILYHYLLHIVKRMEEKITLQSDLGSTLQTEDSSMNNVLWTDRSQSKHCVC